MDVSVLQSLAPEPESIFVDGASKDILGIEDFLKLLTVQLSNQDPLEPMKDTSFIAQMSSFTSLEQMKNLSETLTKFTQNQQAIAAQAYLGKEVTIFAPDGSELSGIVTAVTARDDNVKVTVQDREYDVREIVRVELPKTEILETPAL